MTDRESTDEQLVSRIRAGDGDAAQALFAKHFPLLRARVQKRMDRRSRARQAESDVIQEACLAAFLSLAEFEDRGPGSFGRWLGGILDNKLRESLRRHLRAGKRDARREQGVAGGVFDFVARDRSPSSAAMATEELLTLLRAIEGLPEDYRSVLHLLYEQGLSLRDAAQRMDRSPDAVRMLYGRAIAALAASMRDRVTGGDR